MPAGQVLTRLQRQRADKRKNPPITSLSSIPPPPTKKLKGSTYCQSSENSTIDLDSVTASTSTAYGCEIITNNNCADETYSGTCLNSVPSLGSLAATSTGSSSSSGNCDTSSSTSSSTTTEEEVLSFGNKPFESNNLQYFSAVDTLKRLPLQFSKQNFTNRSKKHSTAATTTVAAFKGIGGNVSSGGVPLLDANFGGNVTNNLQLQQQQHQQQQSQQRNNQHQNSASTIIKETSKIINNKTGYQIQKQVIKATPVKNNNNKSDNTLTKTSSLTSFNNNYQKTGGNIIPATNIGIQNQFNTELFGKFFSPLLNLKNQQQKEVSAIAGQKSSSSFQGVMPSFQNGVASSSNSFNNNGRFVNGYSNGSNIGRSGVSLDYEKILTQHLPATNVQRSQNANQHIKVNNIQQKPATTGRSRTTGDGEYQLVRHETL